jgi:hypothetical protein
MCNEWGKRMQGTIWTVALEGCRDVLSVHRYPSFSFHAIVGNDISNAYPTSSGDFPPHLMLRADAATVNPTQCGTNKEYRNCQYDENRMNFHGAGKLRWWIGPKSKEGRLVA